MRYRRTIRLIPIEPNDAAVVEGDNDVVGVYGDQPVRVFEAESASQVRLAGVSQAIFCCGSLAKVIWS